MEQRVGAGPTPWVRGGRWGGTHMIRDDAACPSVRDAARLLARTEPFAALPPVALEDLAARLVRVDVPAGALLLWQGEQGGHAYLIAAGRVEVWALPSTADPGPRPVRDGEPWAPDPRRWARVDDLGPGGVVGELAPLLGGPRRASARAASDATLYALDGAALRDALACHAGLRASLQEEILLRAAVLALRDAPAFAPLPPLELRWLAARLQPEPVAPGRDLVREGEAGDCLYIVRSGRLAVLARLADGTERQVDEVGPGQVIGEGALLSGDPRAATVRALEPAEVLRLERADLAEALRREPSRRAYLARLALQRQRPRRHDHWRLEPRAEGGGYVLQDTRAHRYLQLSPEGAFLWELMDGEHSVRDLTLAYLGRYRALALDAVLDLILQLQAAGFVRIQRLDAVAAPARAVAVRARLARLAGRWAVHYVSLPDVDPAVGRIERALRPLYGRAGLAALLLLGAAGAAVFLGDLARGGLQGPADLSGWAVAATTLLVSAMHLVLHELGHAVTCKHFGRAVHRAGVGWYLFLPVGYADTSDIWPAGRWARAAVAAAGPAVTFLLAGLAALALPLAGAPWARLALVQAAAVGYTVGVANLNPLFESDGYYVLMDLLDIPNLRRTALGYVGATLRRSPRPAVSSRRARLYLGFGAAVLAYTGLLAWAVLTGYARYVRSAVAAVLPVPVASSLGAAVAGLLVLLIAARTWGELRPAGGLRSALEHQAS